VCTFPLAGPECHVITWNVEKKLVMSTFRHLEPGAKLCLIQKGEKKEPQVDQSFLEPYSKLL
jgi:hypothetical protein